MYGCESWTMKKAWVPKIWCCWTVVLEKTPENPLDCKEIQPVNPEGISSEFSLEGLMLKLKVQYFGYLMWRANSSDKALMLGKIEAEGEERGRGWDGQIASPT